MNPTRAQILDAINHEPAGVTTAQLARKLNATSYAISSNLSKLASYGKIIKERTGTRWQAVWKPVPDMLRSNAT